MNYAILDGKIVLKENLVEVVRCRDCKYRIGGEEGWCIDGIPFNGDDMGRVETEGNDFCSYGERKDDAKTD